MVVETCQIDGVLLCCMEIWGCGDSYINKDLFMEAAQLAAMDGETSVLPYFEKQLPFSPYTDHILERLVLKKNIKTLRYLKGHIRSPSRHLLGISIFLKKADLLEAVFYLFPYIEVDIIIWIKSHCRKYGNDEIQEKLKQLLDQTYIEPY